MISFIRHYLLAVQYFTRIPITGKLAKWVGFSPSALQASASHFPGIGIMIGSLSSLVLLITTWTLPQNPFTPLVGVFISTFTSILLTGAFHEDGLADAADGFGGTNERTRTLEIMKDSRIGTYGALALLLVVGSKIAILTEIASIDLSLAATTLLLGHTISRTLSLAVMRFLPPIIESPDSKSKPLVAGIQFYHLFIGTLWCSIVFIGATSLYSLKSWGFGIALAIGITIFLSRKIRQRLHGYTGDCLGAVQQFAELFFYLGTLFLIGK